MTKPTTVLMTITPEQAKEFLAGNRSNRPFQKTYAKGLELEILRGGWLITHQGIALTADGRLIDGQHRCAAIAAAGIPVEMNVTFNADPASFPVVDTGMRRSVAFALGETTAYAAVVRWLAALADHASAANYSRLTNLQLIAAQEWADPVARRIFDACGSKRQGASVASIIAGAAIRAVISPDPEAVAQAYRAFILLEYSDMPFSVQALERQRSTGALTNNMPKMQLAKSFIAFDLERGEKNIVLKTEWPTLQRMHEIAVSLSRGGNAK